MYQLNLEITDARVEHSLRQIAKKENKDISEIALIAIEQFLQSAEAEQNDPWSNPNVTLPSVDTGITDFARQHDHYLYEK